MITRTRRAVLLVTVLIFQVLLPQASHAASQTTPLHCFEKPDVLVIGARGSGESQYDGLQGYEGFGPTSATVGAKVVERLQDAGLVTASDSLVYPADGAMDWALDFFFPGVTYVDSHRNGVDALIELLGEYDDCQTTGGPPKYVFIGFSQGAHVIRTALAENDHPNGPDLDAKIGAVGLVADPRFRGDSDPGAKLGTWFFGEGVLALQGTEIFPGRYEDDLYQLCNLGDLICEGYGAVIHADYSVAELENLGNKLADQTLIDMGYPAQYQGAIVKWEGDSVTSWYVGADGYRHWIETADIWNCLVSTGSSEHVLSTTELNRIPDAWGDHATCSSGSGGGSNGNGGGSTGIGGFYLPYPSGVSHTVTQARGDGSHECPGNSCEAIDFAMSLNDTVVASDSGTVRQYSTNANNSTGLGRYVMLEHSNGLCTLYGHLEGVASAVTDGNGNITRGQVVGFAGDTGYSFGVHLHFALVNCVDWRSVNVDFVEIAEPVAWGSYTSQNSPPDSDGDGVLDHEDACPNSYGIRESGCPLAVNAGNQSSGPAVVNHDNVLHYFATGGDGNVHMTWRNTNTWATSWVFPSAETAPPGVNFVGTPASIVNSSNTTMNFVMGDDGNVYYLWRNWDGQWTQNEWRLAGNRPAPAGVHLDGGLSASLDAQGALWLFATGDDGNVYALSRDSSGWSNWHLPGGNMRPGGVYLSGAPTSILNNDDVMHVFATGDDGNVYYLWQSASGAWTSTNWSLIGGKTSPTGVQFVGGLSSIVNSWGATQTFVMGDDGNIYYLWRSSDGDWTSNQWRLPGGNAAPEGVAFTGGVSAILTDDQVVQVFATGDDGNVYYLWRTPGRWATDWVLPTGSTSPSGVDFVGVPHTIKTSWNATLTFVFGNDGNVYKLFRNGDGTWGTTGWIKPNGINAPGGVTLQPWNF